MSGEITLGLIGGTGLTEWQDDVERLDIDTPFGAASDPIRVIPIGGVRLLFLPRHGSPHRFPPHRVNYRANMWALKHAGAEQVLAVSAVGGITGQYSPGTLAVPDQLVDFSWGREHSYHDSPDVPLVHVDFTHPYEGDLRRRVLDAARQASIGVVDGACIAVFQGPRLESAAEIAMARNAGCDLAGMTSLPEAGLARELGIDYAGLAVVSNWAAGVGGESISEDDIAQTLKEPMSRVRRLLDALVAQLKG